MAGGPLRTVIRELGELVGSLEPYRGDIMEFAVIAHQDGSAKVACNWTRDRVALHGCLLELGASGAPALPEALAEADRQVGLAEARREASDQLHPRVLVVLGNLDSAECSDAYEAAGRLRERGTIHATACATVACNTFCARELATSARYWLGRLDGRRAARLMWQLHKDYAATRPRHWLMAAELGPNVELDPEGTTPMPSAHSVDGRRLVWLDDRWFPPEGMTYTLRVRPGAGGSVELLRRAEAAILDNRGGRSAARTGGLRVRVIEPAQPVPGVGGWR